MATLPLSLFLGGSVTAIPVVTGVAEGVQYQKKQNEEAANEERMVKFNIDIKCETQGPRSKEIDGGIVVLRHDRVRQSF
jgi:hypothetical protein